MITLEPNICVISTQRTGSTWLMQLLNGTSQLKAYGEIFREVTSPQFIGDSRLKPPLFYKEFRQSSAVGRFKSVGGYLDVIAKDANGRHAFKVMYDQIRARPEILATVARRNFIFIHLVRVNFLDVVVSKELMKQKGLIHSNRKIKVPTIGIAPSNVIRQLWRIDLQVRFFKSLSHLLPRPVMTISYEELTSSPEVSLSKISEFTRVDNLTTAEQEGNWTKTNTLPLNQVVENYDEIISAIDGSRFRYLLQM